MRRVLWLSGRRLPHPTGNGVSVLSHGLLRCFQRLGGAPVVVPVALDYGDSREEARHREYLAAEGIPLLDLHSLRPSTRRWRRRMEHGIFGPKELRPSAALRELEPLLAERGTVAMGIGWDTLPLLSRLPVLRIASLVDPVLPPWRRHGSGWFSEYKAVRRAWLTSRALRKVDLILEHAAQHARELRQDGYANAHYLPHPMEVVAVASAPAAQEDSLILVPGSFKGLVSGMGFELLADRILPELEGTGLHYRVRLVGHGKLPELVRRRLEVRPGVDIAGFSEDIAAELAAATVVLVTVPVPWGFRTRIAEAFGYGATVVAHRANAEGMPELEDGVNVLLGSTGPELARCLHTALTDPALRRRVSSAARRTFEQHYTIDVQTARLARMLGDIGLRLGSPAGEAALST